MCVLVCVCVWSWGWEGGGEMAKDSSKCDYLLVNAVIWTFIMLTCGNYIIPKPLCLIILPTNNFLTRDFPIILSLFLHTSISLTYIYAMLLYETWNHLLTSPCFFSYHFKTMGNTTKVNHEKEKINLTNFQTLILTRTMLKRQQL